MHMSFEIEKKGPLKGTLKIPGDKSISHRAVMLGALASGTTSVENILTSDDVQVTMNAFRAMGVHILCNDQSKTLQIDGVGLHGLKPPNKALYMGNSGTSMRLISGILAAQNFDTRLTGDASLSNRPMNRIIDPLRSMGADISASDHGYPPLYIQRTKNLHGIEYTLPMASAQVKSCLLLAALYAQNKTVITENDPTRDHTERMLKAYGYPIQKINNQVILHGGNSLKGTIIKVPSDISSAAFFIVAASIVPGSEIVLQQIGINPTRDGIIRILKLMGADIELSNIQILGEELVADICVKYASLKGIDIPKEFIPFAIDEFPVIFIAAACAKGITQLKGASELRVKESDRISAMSKGLKNIGIHNIPLDDGIIIHGGTIKGGSVESMGDHRITMAFSIAGMCANNKVVVHGCENVTTSFPNFVNLANYIGGCIQISDTNSFF